MTSRWADRQQDIRQVTKKSGTKLQRKHRPDYQIVLYMGILMMVGLVIIYAIGPQRANVLNTLNGQDIFSDSYFFIKQTASLLLALAAFIAAALIPIAFFKKHAYKILLLGLGLSTVLLIFGNLFHVDVIAQCSLGACRWINLGPFGTLQPAEIVKFGLLLFLGTFLGVRAKQGQINDLTRTLIPAGIVALTALFFIIFIQQDLGTGITIGAILATMLLVGGLDKRIGFILIGAAVVFGILMILVAPHRMERIATFLQGDDTAAVGDSYHIAHAKIAIGTGGLLGVGIGKSVQATGYLPEAINDSVFAILGETFGFVGLAAILGVFSALLFRLLKITDHLHDYTLKLIVAGATGWLGSHVILNVAAMIGVFPLTGITLPLLSFGGTSMLFIATILGLCFQLSRYTSHRSNKEENSRESTYGRRGIRGPRYTSRRSA